MQAEFKKVLLPAIGKVFRDISGKGPEKLYVQSIGNIIVVNIYGYLTIGLAESKLLDDMLMSSATITYYSKVVHNSLESVQIVLKEKFRVDVRNTLCDFEVKENHGVIFYELNKNVESDSAISGAYYNFVRSRITEIFRKNTGAYPNSIDAYKCNGDVLIKVSGFLGSFNETKFRYDEEMVNANKVFYYRMLKNELKTILNDFNTENYYFIKAYCDVNMLDDFALIYLKGDE